MAAGFFLGFGFGPSTALSTRCRAASTSSAWSGGSSRAAALALDAGIDIELPSIDFYGGPLREAVSSGRIDEALVDQLVDAVAAPLAAIDHKTFTTKHLRLRTAGSPVVNLAPQCHHLDLH